MALGGPLAGSPRAMPRVAPTRSVLDLGDVKGKDQAWAVPAGILAWLLGGSAIGRG